MFGNGWNGGPAQVGSVRVLATKATPVSVTGTANKTVLATFTLPAGILGANGAIEIIPTFTYTNSANTKTLSIEFGSTVAWIQTVTTTSHYRTMVTVANRGAANSQMVQGPSYSGGTGGVTSALVTSSTNTANPVTITISGQLTNTGETITLEGFIIKLQPGVN